MALSKDSKFELTAHQLEIFTSVFKFIDDRQRQRLILTIAGSAGTGKTTLTKFIVDYIQSKNLRVVGVAPTHKAKNVLKNCLNKKRIMPIKVYTVASIIGKIRNHSYVGTHRYTESGYKPIDGSYILILDEVSMVCNRDLQKIIDEYHCRIICIGDQYQLPVINNGNDENKNNISYAFQGDNANVYEICRLTEIIRHKGNTELMDIVQYIRDHMYVINDLTEIVPKSSQIQFNQKSSESPESPELKDKLADFQPSIHNRLLSFTNNMVCELNNSVRQFYGFSETKFCQGELLTGYASVGFPNPYIENGMDYIIEQCDLIKTKVIESFTGLCGYQLHLSGTEEIIFVPNINSPENYDFFMELIARAEQVNQPHSKKEHFQKYFQLKNCAIFADDVYKYNDNIYSGKDFKLEFPYMFKYVIDYINPNNNNVPVIIAEKMTADPVPEFILTKRIADNKPIIDGEMFCDSYCIIEKDIDYGYALTIHKSQGSTYSNVMVYNGDFDRMPTNTREKILFQNQLKYVACTRPNKSLTLIV